MNLHHRTSPLAALLTAATFATLCCAASLAAAQTWEYKSFKKTMGGQYNKENYVTGTVSVAEKDGKAVFSVNAGSVDACLRGEIPAVVTKTDATTIVEPQITLAGCEKFRYVIRNDGSGGSKEVWRGEAWKDTGWDHGLKPVAK